jgi:branched-chain amino acid transport system substrate-binding protein
MSSWICDGVPKDGKDYPGFSGPHEPISNDLSDCEYCGLPREAMIASGSDSVTQILGGSGNRSRVILIGAIIGALTLAIGSIAYFTGFTSLINGDRHLKTYEAAVASGDQALSIVGSHNNPEELAQAQEYLSSAIVDWEQVSFVRTNELNKSQASKII